ncbi:M20 family peptidase [Flexivirga caeni]|uniref:M20 family peptidase n=1 Tax=Flexivirga caeni TaxID=2294115 RepID=A0A3M9M6J7_9MICO|nr:M20 family peptidase [Flexivirga caeni]
MEEMLDDIRRLVECESPSADQGAVTRSADVVSSVGRGRLGTDPDRVVVNGCTHLRWRFGDKPARVLVLGHHDTVWPLGTLDRIPYGVRDGVLRGPGCFDMKTGLVQAFHAIAALGPLEGSADGVTLLITGDEEVGSPTSRALIEREATGCVASLVLEASGPGGALKIGRKGVSTYQIKIVGRAAHAGLEPASGINAAVALAQLIQDVLALASPEHGTTVTPTLARAGTTTNTIPAEGSLAVDARMWDAGEQQRVDHAIRALTPSLLGATLTVEGGPNRPPLQAGSSGDLTSLALQVAAETGITQLSTMSVGGASDGNFTAGVGVPTLDGLGAVGDGAHAAHEHVLVNHIVPRTTLLAALLRRLLQGAG